MEPGLRDREYGPVPPGARPAPGLQWSPVLETGNTWEVFAAQMLAALAAMEPGLRDREYLSWGRRSSGPPRGLQWSPVLETGNTRRPACPIGYPDLLQWSPVLETGNTPGREGYKDWLYYPLQWSPVLETGNTRI